MLKSKHILFLLWIFLFGELIFHPRRSLTYAEELQQYYVKDGDTLSSIANKKLRGPIYEKQGGIDRILELNEHLIDDEEKIYPGQILTLPVTAVSDQKKSNPPTAQLPQPAPPVEKKENPIPPVRKVATSEQSSTLRPPPAVKSEPFRTSLIPRLDIGFFRIDSTDTQTGSSSVFASDISYQFNLTYSAYRNRLWNIHLLAGIRAEKFLNKNTSNASLSGGTGSNSHIGAGGSLISFEDLESTLDLRFDQRDFFYTTSATSPINVERLWVPSLRLSENYLFFRNSWIGIGTKVYGSYLLSQTGTNYSVSTGNQFGGGFFLKSSLKNYRFSADLLVEQTQQNTSVATQKETYVFVGLSAYWGRH